MKTLVRQDKLQLLKQTICKTQYQDQKGQYSIAYTIVSKISNSGFFSNQRLLVLDFKNNYLMYLSKIPQYVIEGNKALINSISQDKLVKQKINLNPSAIKQLKSVKNQNYTLIVQWQRINEKTSIKQNKLWHMQMQEKQLAKKWISLIYSVQVVYSKRSQTSITSRIKSLTINIQDQQDINIFQKNKLISQKQASKFQSSEYRNQQQQKRLQQMKIRNAQLRQKKQNFQLQNKIRDILIQGKKKDFQLQYQKRNLKKQDKIKSYQPQTYKKRALQSDYKKSFQLQQVNKPSNRQIQSEAEQNYLRYKNRNKPLIIATNDNQIKKINQPNQSINQIWQKSGKQVDNIHSASNQQTQDINYKHTQNINYKQTQDMNYKQKQNLWSPVSQLSPIFLMTPTNLKGFNRFFKNNQERTQNLTPKSQMFKEIKFPKQNNFFNEQFESQSISQIHMTNYQQNISQVNNSIQKWNQVWFQLLLQLNNVKNLIHNNQQHNNNNQQHKHNNQKHTNNKQQDQKLQYQHNYQLRQQIQYNLKNIVLKFNNTCQIAIVKIVKFIFDLDRSKESKLKFISKQQVNQQNINLLTFQFQQIIFKLYLPTFKRQKIKLNQKQNSWDRNCNRFKEFIQKKVNPNYYNLLKINNYQLSFIRQRRNYNIFTPLISVFQTYGIKIFCKAILQHKNYNKIGLNFSTLNNVNTLNSLNIQPILQNNNNSSFHSNIKQNFINSKQQKLLNCLHAIYVCKQVQMRNYVVIQQFEIYQEIPFINYLKNNQNLIKNDNINKNPIRQLKTKKLQRIYLKGLQILYTNYIYQSSIQLTTHFDFMSLLKFEQNKIIQNHQLFYFWFQLQSINGIFEFRQFILANIGINEEQTILNQYENIFLDHIIQLLQNQLLLRSILQQIKLSTIQLFSKLYLNIHNQSKANQLKTNNQFKNNNQLKVIQAQQKFKRQIKQQKQYPFQIKQINIQIVNKFVQQIFIDIPNYKDLNLDSINYKFLDKIISPIIKTIFIQNKQGKFKNHKFFKNQQYFVYEINKQISNYYKNKQSLHPNEQFLNQSQQYNLNNINFKYIYQGILHQFKIKEISTRQLVFLQSKKQNLVLTNTISILNDGQNSKDFTKKTCPNLISISNLIMNRKFNQAIQKYIILINNRYKLSSQVEMSQKKNINSQRFLSSQLITQSLSNQFISISFLSLIYNPKNEYSKKLKQKNINITSHTQSRQFIQLVIKYNQISQSTILKVYNSLHKSYLFSQIVKAFMNYKLGKAQQSFIILGNCQKLIVMNKYLLSSKVSLELVYFHFILQAKQKQISQIISTVTRLFQIFQNLKQKSQRQFQAQSKNSGFFIQNQLYQILIGQNLNDKQSLNHQQYSIDNIKANNNLHFQYYIYLVYQNLIKLKSALEEFYGKNIFTQLKTNLIIHYKTSQLQKHISIKTLKLLFKLSISEINQQKIDIIRLIFKQFVNKQTDKKWISKSTQNQVLNYQFVNQILSKSSKYLESLLNLIKQKNRQLKKFFRQRNKSLLKNAFIKQIDQLFYLFTLLGQSYLLSQLQTKYSLFSQKQTQS